MRSMIPLIALLLLVSTRVDAWEAGYATVSDNEHNPRTYFSSFLSTPESAWQYSTSIASAWVEQTKCYRAMRGAHIVLRPGTDYNVFVSEGITRKLLRAHGLEDARINRQPNGVYLLHVATKASFAAALAAATRHERLGAELYWSLPGVHYSLDNEFTYGTPPWALLPADRKGAWMLNFGPFEDEKAARMAANHLQRALHIPLPTVRRVGLTPGLVQGFLWSAE